MSLAIQNNLPYPNPPTYNITARINPDGSMTCIESEKEGK
jgi:hypothetical protein